MPEENRDNLRGGKWCRGRASGHYFRKARRSVEEQIELGMLNWLLRATFASFLLLHLVYFVKAFRPRCIVSSTRLRTSCKRHKCSLLFERIIPSFASIIKTVNGNERQFLMLIIIFEMKNEKKNVCNCKRRKSDADKMFRAVFLADSIYFIE